LDATHQTEYQKRLDALKETIRQTDKNVKALLKNADRTFLIYHPALSYFARDYGLKQISIEEGGKEPSPAQLKALIETCRKENAHTIFIQQEFDQRNAQLIANELGINIVSINPLSYDWAEEMVRVAKALKH
jgi:zinc transport system substrate-binding protein